MFPCVEPRPTFVPSVLYPAVLAKTRRMEKKGGAERGGVILSVAGSASTDTASPVHAAWVKAKGIVVGDRRVDPPAPSAGSVSRTSRLDALLGRLGLGFPICRESIILYPVTEVQGMEWTAATLDRLHELHGQYLDRLLADISAVNRLLGSRNPGKTGLKYLTRDEFEALLTQPVDDPEVTRLWIRRIIRGHECEFPQLDDATNLPALRGEPRTAVSESHRRKTGT